MHTARPVEESKHFSPDEQDAPKLFITEHGEADGETSIKDVKVARLVGETVLLLSKKVHLNNFYMQNYKINTEEF